MRNLFIFTLLTFGTYTFAQDTVMRPPDGSADHLIPSEIEMENKTCNYHNVVFPIDIKNLGNYQVITCTDAQGNFIKYATKPKTSGGGGGGGETPIIVMPDYSKD